MNLAPYEEAVALAHELPQLSAATQFELALILLEELELDSADLARMHERYPSSAEIGEMRRSFCSKTGETPEQYLEHSSQDTDDTEKLALHYQAGFLKDSDA